MKESLMGIWVVNSLVVTVILSQILFRFLSGIW